MNDADIEAIEARLNAAKWDAVTEPMIFSNEGAVVIILPDATVASVSGAPVQKFLEYVKDDLHNLISELRRMRGDNRPAGW